MRKMLLLPGVNTQIVQPLPSHYSDYSIQLFTTVPEGHFLLNMHALTSDISGLTAVSLLGY